VGPESPNLGNGVSETKKKAPGRITQGSKITVYMYKFIYVHV
jgi:hypothetical protein